MSFVALRFPGCTPLRLACVCIHRIVKIHAVVMRNREVIDAEIQHERDFAFDYFGFKVRRFEMRLFWRFDADFFYARRASHSTWAQMQALSNVVRESVIYASIQPPLLRSAVIEVHE